MSKWAVWAAHRYLERGTNTRTVGADGRLLHRPWRVRRAEVRDAARRERAARAQPFWPHPLGWVLIGIAAFAVIDADNPIPSHGGDSSTFAGGSLRRLTAKAPVGPNEGVPATCRWFAYDVPPPFSVVLLDEGYNELARQDDIGGTTWRPTGPVADELGKGGVFHWYVESTTDGKPTRSLLARLEIR